MTDPLGLIGQASAARGAARPAAPQGEPTTSFKDVLMKNLEQVNKLQKDAEAAIEDLYTGKRNDVAGVAIAQQKADLAFQALLQVRNKLMDAYEEVKQIRV